MHRFHQVRVGRRRVRTRDDVVGITALALTVVSCGCWFKIVEQGCGAVRRAGGVAFRPGIDPSPSPLPQGEGEFVWLVGQGSTLPPAPSREG
jgi:hypothetical protein